MKRHRPPRILVALVLSGVASACLATNNWLRLGDSPRAEILIDPGRVERPPSYVKMWTMLNYKQRQRGGWLSEKRLFLFSCKDRTLEWQQSMYFADPMGEGDLVDLRTLNPYGSGDLRLAELDPASKDKRKYSEAVPESGFISVFAGMC